MRNENADNERKKHHRGRRRKKKGNIIANVILVIALIVFCVSGFQLFKIGKGYLDGRSEYDKVRKLAVTDDKNKNDKDKNILIATSHVMLNSIMDNVNEASDTAFYSQPIEGLDLYEVGKKAVEAFDTRSRFFHFEFFRLDEDRDGLGKKGDIVGLEVNMRAPGAYMPDMMNFAYNVDVYTIWADMVKYNQCFYDIKREYWVAYTGRREGFGYAHNYDQIREIYGQNIALETDVEHKKNYLK